MRITVFGASGKVGRRVVELGLGRGHTVVAFVHHDDPFVSTPNLIIKKGDIYSADDVSDAVKNSDAIISCLGSWGTKHKNVLTSAMRNIIPAMEHQGVTRIITLTGTGAVAPDEAIKSGHRLLMKLLAPFPAGKVFADGEQHMQLLASSKLDWTSVRSPIMKVGADTTYQLDLQPDSGRARISREAVATSLLDQLEANDFLRQAPVIHHK